MESPLRPRWKGILRERDELIGLDPFFPDEIAIWRQPKSCREDDARSIVLRKRRQYRPGAERRFSDELSPSSVTKRGSQNFRP